MLVTLTIYWGAERYARIVAERIHEGHRPSWTSVRHQLTHGWEMVTASTLPLLTLAIMTFLGADAAHGRARGPGLQHGAAHRGRLVDRAWRPAVDAVSGSSRRCVAGHVRRPVHPAQDLPALTAARPAANLG